MGQLDEARGEWREALRVNPDYSLEHRRKVLPYKNPCRFRVCRGWSAKGRLGRPETGAIASLRDHCSSARRTAQVDPTVMTAVGIPNVRFTSPPAVRSAQIAAVPGRSNTRLVRPGEGRARPLVVRTNDAQPGLTSTPRGTTGARPSPYLTRPPHRSVNGQLLRGRTRSGFVPFVQRARQRTQADRGTTLP